jgi:hypothetical protein
MGGLNGPFIYFAEGGGMRGLISRMVVLVLPLLAGGCVETAATVVGAGVATIPLIGRTPPDAVISLVTGRDCSVVRLDAGKGYCAPVEPKPTEPVVCTRSLGVVDCWSNPKDLGVPITEVADGPRVLTPAQEARRMRWWPGFQ